MEYSAGMSLQQRMGYHTEHMKKHGYAIENSIYGGFCMLHPDVYEKIMKNPDNQKILQDYQIKHDI